MIVVVSEKDLLRANARIEIEPLTCAIQRLHSAAEVKKKVKSFFSALNTFFENIFSTSSWT